MSRFRSRGVFALGNTYVALCSPHWAATDKLLCHLFAPPSTLSQTSDSLIIVVPSSSLIVSRPSNHEFLRFTKSFSDVQFLGYFASMGWKQTRSYRLLRVLAVVDRLRRLVSSKTVDPRHTSHLYLNSLSAHGAFLLTCPTAFDPVESSEASSVITNLLRHVPLLLARHGNPFNHKLIAQVPSAIENAKFYFRNEIERDALMAKGWNPSSLVQLNLSHSRSQLAPRSVLFLSRASDDANIATVSSHVEMLALRWIGLALKESGRELYVRLHPAEPRYTFVARWFRARTFKRFRFDTSIQIPNADVTLTIQSTAILVSGHEGQRFEIVPLGMLNERVGGPLIGHATRQGEATTLFTLASLIEALCG